MERQGLEGQADITSRQEEGFSSGPCRAAAVGLLVGFPELGAALLGAEPLLLDGDQLMSCLLTLSLSPSNIQHIKQGSRGTDDLSVSSLTHFCTDKNVLHINHGNKVMTSGKA